MLQDFLSVYRDAIIARTRRRGTVSINGSTGAVLSRSLIGIQNLVDTTLTDVRLSANQQRRERVAITALLEEIAVAARLDADHRGQQFVIEAVDPDLVVDVDPQLLASAVKNLLNNASKFTPAGGRITLRALRHDSDLRIEIEDACGGIPGGSADLFQPFGERRGKDQTGMGWASPSPGEPCERTAVTWSCATCPGRVASLRLNSLSRRSRPHPQRRSNDLTTAAWPDSAKSRPRPFATLRFEGGRRSNWKPRLDAEGIGPASTK